MRAPENPAPVTDGFVMDQERKVCHHRDNRFQFIRDKANWTAPAFMVCGDTLDGVLGGVAGSKNAGSPRGWSSIRFDDRDYSTAVNLDVGYALTFDWDRIGDAYYFRGMKRGAYHTCGDKDYRNCPAIGPTEKSGPPTRRAHQRVHKGIVRITPSYPSSSSWCARQNLVNLVI